MWLGKCWIYLHTFYLVLLNCSTKEKWYEINLVAWVSHPVMFSLYLNMHAESHTYMADQRELSLKVFILLSSDKYRQ